MTYFDLSRRNLVSHFESRRTIYSYQDFGLKPAVFGCLTNAIAPPLIVLESLVQDSSKVARH